jgi:hypothetical protein
MVFHDYTQLLIHAELLRQERLHKDNLKQFDFKRSGKSRTLWIEILKVAKSLLISKESNAVSQKKENESRYCVNDNARGRVCLPTKEHQVSICAE